MLELQELANVFSGVATRGSKHGSSRFMRLADLTDMKAGRMPAMIHGEPPEVARALPIEEGDLIVAARGGTTDVCTANESIFGAYISLDLYLVRPRAQRINPEYLRTFLELPSTQAVMAREKQGSALARLPKEALEKITIPVPPLHQQRLIAGLALCIEDQRMLLKRLGGLRDVLGQEALSRAVRSAEANFSRRST
jgi:hypothetical protein